MILILVAAALLGVVAGLRALTAPAAVTWAASLGLLKLAGTPLGFLGAPWAPWLFTVAALGEFVTDQLPITPSRKTPPQFAARVASGAMVGAAVGLGHGLEIAAAVAGVAGAVAGTLGGAAARADLAARFGRDRPAALIEDAVAVGAAAAIVGVLL